MIYVNRLISSWCCRKSPLAHNTAKLEESITEWDW